MRNTHAQMDSTTLLDVNDTRQTNYLKKGVFIMSHVVAFMLGYFVSSQIYVDASTGSCE
jgi:hypothetical protein